ncbi:TetR/AcrR family transcriptional regulator [Butyrivibrio sp.]|uniref:TetR/AcrR family transcriptional regulator n=1 Tax=Butyrivibrio sp. TaxID=28121 RepID=UPI0025C00340|nr:TetR/AcrR family transcriptional regulator [Butyrivibrio sp.]MBQ9302827.1 TetR/AcrR family transcriptional regulator [Butyrivibrio sp.]
MSTRDTSIDPKLLQCAKDEFMKHGFIKAELKTICDNAGITTGAIYKRYKGKEELFQAVVSDAAMALDEFISDRTNVDFSGMTDDEVRNTWIMNEEYTLGMFEMLWSLHDGFVLLLEKSAGTSYENYRHDFAHRMTHAYMQYYSEAKRRGLAKADISEAEMHVLCTAFWTAVYEPFVHDMTWNEVKEHCKVLCRYFDWAGAISLN